ncbi:ankyrin repeat domain-containing protein [Phormidesmis priestleyi]
MSKVSRWVYSLRFFVILIWSFSAFVFWLLIRIRILAWLAVLPEGLAKVAIVLASQTGMIVFFCAAVGASSLFLWRRFSVKQAAGFAVLISVLLWVGSLSLGRIDMQGTESYVLDFAQRGDVRNTREQLLIKMVQCGLNLELQTLIQIGTDVNARDLKGQSALYWARDPEQVKPLLQAGAKPDGESLLQAAFWGRLDTMKLLFAATPDDGKALVAEVGDQALRDATGVRASGEQDRSQMIQLLVARGAKPISDQSNRDRR